MRICLLFTVALLVNAPAFAAPAQAPVLIQPESSRSGDHTIKLQTSEGASCSTPVIGNCGACAVSCATGQAASCKPGIAVGPQASASCVTPPECKCK